MKEFKSTGDPDTDAVLKEMAEDGEELPNFGKPEPAPEMELKSEAPKELETKVETKELVAEAKVEDDKGEEDEDEEELDSKESVEVHKPRSVPIQKYEYWKEKARKLQEQLGKAVKKPDETDDEIKTFAKENQMDETQAFRLAELISKKAIPPHLKEALEETLKFKEERDKKTAEEARLRAEFDNEFNRGVIPFLKQQNPEISEGDIKEIYKSLDTVAWDNDTPLLSLYLSNQKVFKKTGESSKVRSGFKGKNLNNPTSEDVADIVEEGSDEEFWELSEKVGAQSRGLTK